MQTLFEDLPAKNSLYSNGCNTGVWGVGASYLWSTGVETLCADGWQCAHSLRTLLLHLTCSQWRWFFQRIGRVQSNGVYPPIKARGNWDVPWLVDTSLVQKPRWARATNTLAHLPQIAAIC
ncbi:MAG: hypothetical protein ACI8ZN_002494 [Bacteroidia bacterium]|jgi:hypothetical protein